jgi:hypothetical protein
MEFYQITKEAMDNQTMKKEDIIEGHVYVWPTNGVEANINLPIPYPIHKRDGTYRKSVGFIDATRYNLKKCTRNEAYDACWQLGGFRNKWDNYNCCYREDLCDQDGRPVEIVSLENLSYRTHFSKSTILKYFQNEGFDVINR